MALKNYNIPPLENLNSLSESWLSQVLTTYYDTDCNVLSFKMETSVKKEGFLSEIAYINAKLKINDEEKDEHLVIKCMPTAAKQRKFMKNGKLAEREIEFYKFSQTKYFKEVVDKSGLTLVVPEVMYSEFRDSNLTIVMKNLKLLNYKTVINKDGTSLEHTLRIFSSIAVIHASGLYHYKQLGTHELKNYDNTSFFDQFLCPNLERLCEIYKDSNLFSVFHQLIPLYKDIRNSVLTNPLFETIIHGDLWAGQCMFSEDEKDICILDWQFSTVGNPIVDLMCVLFLSSDPSILESHINEVLKHYWKELTKNLDNLKVDHPVSFEEFTNCVENHWITGFFVLAASVYDFLGGDNLSGNRLKRYMNFLNKKNVFTRFIKEYGNSNK